MTIDAADEVGDNQPSCAFVGHNARSRELLRDGLGNLFPVLLACKGAIDMVIVDLMCPPLSVGACPKQVSDVMLELASKKHAHNYLRCEQDIKRKRERALGRDCKKGKLFSELRGKGLTWRNYFNWKVH